MLVGNVLTPALSGVVQEAFQQTLESYNGFGPITARPPLSELSTEIISAQKTQIELARLLVNGAFIEQGIDLVLQKIMSGGASTGLLLRALECADRCASALLEQYHLGGSLLAEKMLEGARLQEHRNILQVELSLTRASGFLHYLGSKGILGGHGHRHRLSKLCEETEDGIRSCCGDVRRINTATFDRDI